MRRMIVATAGLSILATAIAAQQIRLRQGHDATEDEIRDFCRGQIATFKIPRYTRFVAEFPMTVTGKIQKFRMREQMLSELGLSVEQTA